MELANIDEENLHILITTEQNLMKHRNITYVLYFDE